jgi:hypothetical protein
VDGVFYGEVQEWNKTTTGVYNKVTVTASLELYAKDGTRLWEGSDTQSKVAVPQGGQGIGGEIVVHALGNLLLTPMTPYGKAVARNIARQVPGGLLDGRGIGKVPDDATRGTGTPAEGGGTR